MAHHWVDLLFDKHKVEVEALVRERAWGTAAWYIQMLYKYQHGDSLELLPNGQYGYPTIDTAKQIIKRATWVELATGENVVKIAKINAGTLGPLTTLEVNGVTAYLRLIKAPGTFTTVVSLNPDRLRIEPTFCVYFYDAQFSLDAIKASIDTQIDAYLAALPYDGLVSIQRINDALQKSLGWRDHLLGFVSAKPAGGTFNTYAVDYNPTAGYIVMDAPFSTLLTFTPRV